MSILNPGRIVVVGAGMVAHRFVEQLIAKAPDTAWYVTVIGDEDTVPYDRVHLSDLFLGRSHEDLALNPSVWDASRTKLIANDRVEAIDRDAQTVATRSGAQVP